MTWLVRNLVSDGDVTTIEPSLGGIAYPEYRGLISGEPESLKSWLAAILCVEQIKAGNNVAWIDFEQGKAMTRERFAALGVTLDEFDRILYFEPRDELGDQSRDDVRDELKQARPTLSVFDAYAGLLGLYDGDPNSERDIERVNRRVVDVFREHGAATQILDHVVKSKDNRGRYSSGSGRKLAEVETHIGLVRINAFGRGKSGSVRLDNHKDRLGALRRPLGELHLESDADTGRVTWEIRHAASSSETPTTFRPTHLMERLSRYLELKIAPESFNSVEKSVTGKAHALRAGLEILVLEGFVLENRTTSSRMVWSNRPYREDADLVPPRPDLVPGSSPTLPIDLVPSSPSLEEGRGRGRPIERDNEGAAA